MTKFVRLLWLAGPPINKFRHDVDNEFASDCSDAPPGATYCGSDDRVGSKGGYLPNAVNVYPPFGSLEATVSGLRGGYPYSLQVMVQNGIDRFVGTACCTSACTRLYQSFQSVGCCFTPW